MSGGNIRFVTPCPPAPGDKVQCDGFEVGGELGKLHPGGGEHPLGGQGGGAVGVFIGKVQHFLYTALNDGLGALVAGKQGHIQAAASQVPPVGVEDGVQLRVDHIGVLGLGPLPLPGVLVVGTALGHAVVARGNDDVVLGHDTGAHLGVGVLAPLCRQHGNAHKVFVPADIVLPFHNGPPFG